MEDYDGGNWSKCPRDCRFELSIIGLIFINLVNVPVAAMAVEARPDKRYSGMSRLCRVEPPSVVGNRWD
jgi:hypothetical protein